MSVVLDIAITSWIAALLVLLAVFFRYVVRMSQRYQTWRQCYWEISAVTGMSVYGIGNLILICWFWWKVFHGQIFVTGNMSEANIVVVGILVSIVGILCKIRVFSDTNKEATIWTGFIAAWSFVSAMLMRYMIGVG